RRKGCEVMSAATGEEALRILRNFDPTLVLLGSQPDSDAMDCIGTLERVKQIKPEVTVLVLASPQQADLLFRASKAGADDFLAKPVDPSELDKRLARLPRVIPANLASSLPVREQVRRQSDFSMLFGTSPKMEEVKMTVEQVADTNVTVLIRG